MTRKLDIYHLRIARQPEKNKPYSVRDNMGGGIQFKGSRTVYGKCLLDDLREQEIIDSQNKITLYGSLWVALNNKQNRGIFGL